MKITLLCVGKTSFGYLKEGIALYADRMKRYASFSIVEIPDRKKGEPPISEWQKMEGEQLLDRIGASDYLVLLDERGRQLSSEEFAGFVEDKINRSLKHLVFAVGGAYGFSPELYARANDKLSFSRLTFSHQLVRLIFMEQVYRAFTIIRGEPYHHA